MTTRVVSVKVADIRPEYNDLLHWCSDPRNVYIARAGIVFIERNNNKFRYPFTPSTFANPYKLGKNATREDRTKCLEDYREYITDLIESDPEIKAELFTLEGKTLGCWCRSGRLADEPGVLCHGDILVELIEKYK